MLYDRGQCVPVEALVIAGTGMLAMQRKPGGAGTASEESQLRASRTAGALGLELFSKVCAACVTLGGAGRLGSLVAFHLAGFGVPHLRLIDPDRLGWENLDAMPGLSEEDIGRPKVAALAERLLDFRSDLLVSWLQTAITDPKATQLARQRTDLLITCVLLTINSIAVGIGVQMWLDFLGGGLRTSYWNRLRWVPGGAMQVDGGPVGRANDCRFCPPV
jgi:hypothetical protein